MLRAIAIAVLLAGVLSASVAHAQPANFNPDVAAAVEGNNQFAFDLYARLAQKPGNTFFSPYSISNALAMTYAGANGPTATEMAQTLHFTLEGERLHSSLGAVIRQLQGNDQVRPFKLNTVNRLWAQNGLAIRPKFLGITQSAYQSGLQLVDFKSDPDGGRQTINRWVEQQTNDKIKELLKPGTIQRQTRLVLTNAIYFKADWLSPFTKESTLPQDFTIPGTPAFKVRMMRQLLTAAYMATNDYQLVQLPYKGNEVSMVVILPKKVDGLAAVEKKLSARSLRENLAKTQLARLDLSMPKFKMTEEFKLKDELVALGMPTAFSNQADFSGMADTSLEPLKIDDVIHKAFVEVDEKGTEAAAATAVIMAYGAAPGPPMDPPIPFRADHPFLVVILHNATGSILFLGRVNDPGQHVEGGLQQPNEGVGPGIGPEIGPFFPPPQPGRARPVATGALILQVLPGSPATRLVNLRDGMMWTMEAGDIITHINGVQINSVQQYQAGFAPGRITLRVIDGKNGQTRIFAAQPQGGLLGVQYQIISPP